MTVSYRQNTWKCRRPV